MSELVAGNRLDLLCTGGEYFPALLTQIAQAKYEIRMETYIFEADVIGHQVAGALCAAAKRGVKIRLLVDGFGAAKFAESVAPKLREGGVEIQIYRPEVNAVFFRNPFRRHRLRRLHRKLSVFDGRIGFVGGINIVDDSPTPETPPRFDYAVCIEGPVVAEIHKAMRHVWRNVMHAAAGFRHHPPPSPAQAGPSANAGVMNAGLVIRDNLRHRRDIEAAYLQALQSARHKC